MKTNITLILSMILIFSSCESRKGRKIEKVSPQRSDTLIFSPENIRATELIEEFILYPKCDGVTGIKISFSIEIEYEGKTYQVDMHRSQSFSENITGEKIENDPSTSDLILAHYLVSNTPKNYINVIVVGKEVIKLTRRSAFIGNELYPTKIIWEKRNN